MYILPKHLFSSHPHSYSSARCVYHWVREKLTFYMRTAHASKYQCRFCLRPTRLNSPRAAHYTDGFVWPTQMLVIQILQSTLDALFQKRPTSIIEPILIICLACMNICHATLSLMDLHEQHRCVSHAGSIAYFDY